MGRTITLIIMLKINSFCLQKVEMLSFHIHLKHLSCSLYYNFSSVITLSKGQLPSLETLVCNASVLFKMAVVI